MKGLSAVNQKKRNYSQFVMLAVLAHPDDESFGMGGTLALYASLGAQVHLVCATNGELGDVPDEQLNGHANIAELRISELRCAGQILGLKGIHLLGYRDSGMAGTAANSHPQALAAQPLDEVAARIVHYFRLLKPDVVLTFDPIGGYRHPDHIACHQATVSAFEQAANPGFAPDGLALQQPKKLYFHIFPHGMVRWAVRILPLIGQDPRKWGRNKDIDLTALAVEDFPRHAVINYRPVQDKKSRAAVCHASQGGTEMSSGLTAMLMRLFGSKENFMRAHPPVRTGDKRERDLLAGL
jgi:N-acetyl-1-D-myo-inositol-2-amino-2-deoxy-alpha-D-glucopyranoside deacetylase